MSIADTIDAPLDLFGGLVTDMPAADLPQGVSPDCQDVAFLQGAVKTRPGLLSVFSPIVSPTGGNPTVNYLKSYTQPNLAQTLLALDAAGTLWGENSPGVLSQVATGLPANAAASSTSLFGREYIALHDGQFGVDVPRQYDGTNFDRVSQAGPGAGVTAINDIVANISAISRTSGIVTVTTATPHGLIASDQVTIAGVTDASFNGTFAVATLPDSLQQIRHLEQSGHEGSQDQPVHLDIQRGMHRFSQRI